MNFQITQEALLRPEVLYPTFAAVTGITLGWLLGRIQALRAVCSSGRGEAETQRSEELRDLRKNASLLQNENTKLSTFLFTMPDLARQLNSNLEKRKIPALLISFIEQLFEAEQILVFLTTNDGKHLTLSANKGIPDQERAHEVVPFGRGRIGWVAWQQITMDEDDFNQKSRVSKGELGEGVHPLFRTELCAPMVSKDQTLGVIGLGGLLRRPRNEKNMLRMVADLGSIAIQNSTLFKKIQESADRDGLTGLSNKSHFMARIADEILKADKEHKNLSLFLFDIDHFKIYNDTNGHLAGDEALKIMGRLLSSTIRQEDLAARYGGEEFIVLLPNTDKQGAAVAAEKIRKAVESCSYPHQESQPGGRVTISGGVATFPYDARSTADLIRCADRGLYQGKRDGRNRICIYEPRYLSDETGEDRYQQVSQKQEI